MREFYGRQATPELRAARDAAVRAHYAEHKDFALASKAFGLDRIKISQILKAQPLDERSEQTQP